MSWFLALAPFTWAAGCFSSISSGSLFALWQSWTGPIAAESYTAAFQSAGALAGNWLTKYAAWTSSAGKVARWASAATGFGRGGFGDYGGGWFGDYGAWGNAFPFCGTAGEWSWASAAAHFGRAWFGNYGGWFGNWSGSWFGNYGTWTRAFPSFSTAAKVANWASAAVDFARNSTVPA